MAVYSGQTEPVWPTKKGARVVEYSDLAGTAIAAPPEDTTPPQLPPDIDDRYGRRYNYSRDGSQLK